MRYIDVTNPVYGTMYTSPTCVKPHRQLQTPSKKSYTSQYPPDTTIPRARRFAISTLTPCHYRREIYILVYTHIGSSSTVLAQNSYINARYGKAGRLQRRSVCNAAAQLYDAKKAISSLEVARRRFFQSQQSAGNTHIPAPNNACAPKTNTF